MPQAPKKCFIIMPFGRKTDGNGETIDFDVVYHELFREPVVSMGFEPIRCDEITTAGSIHEDMFRHIAADDLAIVDITTNNPNVFYELGVRHALRPAMTILTKARGTNIPFNIAGQRVIDYPSANGSFADARAEIARFIRTGLLESRVDSPIFAVLQEARKDWQRERIAAAKEYPYRLRSDSSRLISIITGDLRDWRGIDVWVNSENVNMQMARFYDRSLSAIIRYEGAMKDDNGEVTDDVIADELIALLKDRQSVTPGSVYVTGSGALARTRGVKRIFHAATTHGVPGTGYQVISEVEQCVTRALERMDQERFREENLGSIVFPMMGTGNGGGHVDVIAPRLLQAAVSYLAAHTESSVRKVYFAAWNHRDLQACQAALAARDDIDAC
ncbi:macro domain-containing protein [Amycolatopsis sp. NPDC048633]|uniref:macro domain-containing protein n=1 Tax=Amycolatopsis sp. NPDC048633 TaxID=3157095 RepID=UPI0033F5FD07